MGYRKSDYFHDKDVIVGDNIIRYLKSHGITQRSMAYELFDGVPLQINLRLKGKSKLTIGEYMAICEWLDVPYDTFLKKGGKSNGLEHSDHHGDTGVSE